ncbi:MAG: N-acetylmuramoyl-L-alanine amidase, partial [Psychromonas sp.]
MKITTKFFIRLLFLSALFMQALVTPAGAAQSNQLKAARAWPSPDNTRVVFDFSAKPDYQIHYLQNPDRLVLDLKSTTTAVNLNKIKHPGPLLNRLRESPTSQKNTYRLVMDLNRASKAKVFVLPPAKPYGYRLVFDLPHNKSSNAKTTKSNNRPSQGRNIMIAIDAGHGGDDPGAVGKYSKEKNITLQIAKRLHSIINKQSGMSAFLIRKGDYFVDLNKRSEIARKGEADFLVSIHADGFTSTKPRGASVLVLSMKRATSEQGRWMENHEARSELIGGTGILMQDSDNLPYLQKMVLDMSMGNAMDVGFKVGDFVVGELRKVTTLHQSKPVHASLAVLKSPDIPSILVEAG